MDIERLEAPVPDQLADELLRFWETVFGTSYEAFRPLLRGGESSHNSDTVYVCRCANRLIGTCHVTIPKALPLIAGLGEVGTAGDFRRRGIANELCKEARNDFRDRGGEAIFLGTDNPAAARLYRRLGWREIPGSNVMANITVGDSLWRTGSSPETFLNAYFSEIRRGEDEAERITVSQGSPADRIPMIPLLVYPYKGRVLDANTRMYSTFHAHQPSCMGLYPRYEALARDGKGVWFAARSGQGKTVGLSTARLTDEHHAEIDAFAHDRFMSKTRRGESKISRGECVWERLAEAAAKWSASMGATSCSALVCEEDEEKLSRFTSLAFRATGAGQPFVLGPRKLASVRMERSL